MSPLHYAFYGVKNRYQVFFHSEGLDTSAAEVKRALGDVRSLVRYQSVDLRYYAVEWVGDKVVYTAYMATYDWVGRENAFVAVSLLVPQGKYIDGGTVAILDQLLRSYYVKYVGSDYKIKQGKEDKALFDDMVRGITLADENQGRKPIAGQRFGVVRYDPGQVDAYLDNPYLPEFAAFTKVFFLPARQRRIVASPKLKPILSSNGTAPEPRSRAAATAPPPSSAPRLERDREPAAAPLAKAPPIPPTPVVPLTPEPSETKSIKTAPKDPPAPTEGGSPGVGKEEVRPSVPPKIVPIEQAAAQEVAKTRPAEELETGQVSIKLPKSATVWVNTKRWIDGPLSLTFLFRDAVTKEAIRPNKAPSKLAVNNLGGSFYTASDQVTIKGLYPGDKLMGNVTVEGYHVTIFEYFVPEDTPEMGQLPNCEIKLLPMRAPEASLSDVGLATSPVKKPLKRKQVTSKAKAKPNDKQGNGTTLGFSIGAVLLLFFVLAIAGWWPFNGSRPDNPGITDVPGRNGIEGTPEQQREQEQLSLEASLAQLTQEVIRFAQDTKLYPDAKYAEYLAYFDQGGTMSFSSVSQRDATKNRLQAMREVSNAEYRSRQGSGSGKAMADLEKLQRDGRLNSQQRIAVSQLLADKLAEAKRNEEALKKAEEKKRLEGTRELIATVNAIRLYRTAAYQDMLYRIKNNKFLTSAERKTLTRRVEVMSYVARVKEDEKNGKVPPTNPLLKYEKDPALTAAQRKYVAKLARE